MDQQPFQGRRQVYKTELKRRTGYGDSWLRKLQDEGQIPRGRRDPGGKRTYWFDDEADAIVEGIPQQLAAETGKAA